MSDFRKLQNLVNEYYGQYSDFPGGKYAPNEYTKNSYRKGEVPTKSPASSQMLSTPFPGTTPIESEEDTAISKNKVLKMINQELKQATDEGMDYCVLVLLKLQKFISQA